jgi:L-arabinokinase
MGLSIILQSLGIDHKEIRDLNERKHSEAMPFDGYLANISVKTFEEKFSNLIPGKMAGKEFKGKHGVITDTVSHIMEEEVYDIYNCTKHPVYENERIHKFMEIMKRKPLEKEVLGTLMLESHQGYVDCGLSCKEADFIIGLVKEKRKTGQVYGARITGGGSGGTVCILCEKEDNVQEIQAAYELEFSNKSKVFSESADGAYYIN